jgi:hypothetical protein
MTTLISAIIAVLGSLWAHLISLTANALGLIGKMLLVPYMIPVLLFSKVFAVVALLALFVYSPVGLLVLAVLVAIAMGTILYGSFKAMNASIRKSKEAIAAGKEKWAEYNASRPTVPVGNNWLSRFWHKATA